MKMILIHFLFMLTSYVAMQFIFVLPTSFYYITIHLYFNNIYCCCCWCWSVVVLLFCCSVVLLFCCCSVVVLLLFCCCFIVVLLLFCCCFVVVLLFCCCFVVVLLLFCCSAANYPITCIFGTVDVTVTWRHHIYRSTSHAGYGWFNVDS